jgi:hypothetical protein
MKQTPVGVVLVDNTRAVSQDCSPFGCSSAVLFSLALAFGFGCFCGFGLALFFG